MKQTGIPLRSVKNYAANGDVIIWKNVHDIKFNKNIIKQTSFSNNKIKISVALGKRPERCMSNSFTNNKVKFFISISFSYAHM